MPPLGSGQGQVLQQLERHHPCPSCCKRQDLATGLSRLFGMQGEILFPGEKKMKLFTVSSVNYASSVRIYFLYSASSAQSP